jgi:MFS family permease
VVGIIMRAVILGRLVDRFGETRVMRIGALIFALGLALYTLPRTIVLMALAIAVVPIGQALLFPSVTALSSHRSDPRELGQMMGVQQSFGGAARVVGPLWATWVYGHVGPSAPFLAAGGIMLFVAMLAFQVPLAARPEPELAAAD